MLYKQKRLCRDVLQALLEGYSATDADLREQVKAEGSMATVAFVCGRQLVVATAGTSCAYLDTGAHIYPVREHHVSVDGVGVDHLAPLIWDTILSVFVVLLHVLPVSIDDGVIAPQHFSTHSHISVDGGTPLSSVPYHTLTSILIVLIITPVCSSRQSELPAYKLIKPSFLASLLQGHACTVLHSAHSLPKCV